MPPVGHVFFDVGGTLIRPAPSMGDIYRRVLLPLGIDQPADSYGALFSEVWDGLSREVGTGRDRYSAFGTERAFWRTYVERVLGRLGAGDCVDDATDRLHQSFADPASWAVFPDVIETLEALRGAGTRCGVISNWDSRLPGLLEGLGLAGFLSPIVWSSAVGSEKPEPAIFEAALGQAGALRDRAVHVGDDLTADVRGAEAVGMKGVLINRHDAPVPAGVRSVASLRQMPEILTALSAPQVRA